ncbi:helix-turn-helix domain-containing protein [Craterilacuibacter sp.]|uniref:helix-turn-helix domain-containing protein n=1 Tax=Craterilacuibacter sp. TaxID=2870909 RepID=UPI003F3779A1
MEPADKIVDVAVSAGARLKQEREAQQLSLGDVAERLKLSVRQLEAIERDDYGFLPGPTFVRGFVRNYARFLGMDQVPLMHLLDEAFPPLNAEIATPSPVESESGTSTGVPRMVLALGVAAIVAATGWWFSSRNSEPAIPSGDLSPMLTVEQPAAVDVVAEVAPQASVPAAAALPAATAAAAPVVASAPVVAMPAVVTAGSPVLRLSSDQEAWISVTDAKGQKLMFGALLPGEDKILSGTPPYRVRIGNASRVKVIYKDQPVDMTGKIRGSTATLKLD